jgi:hypothetical protein
MVHWCFVTTVVVYKKKIKNHKIVPIYQILHVQQEQRFAYQIHAASDFISHLWSNLLGY